MAPKHTTAPPLLLLLPLLALLPLFLSAVTIAEYEQCVQELQKYPLTVCRTFVKHGSDVAGNPPECCEQLRQVSNSCRCELLDMMTGAMMMKEMEGGQCHGRCEEIMMRGSFLSIMCAAGPPCCQSFGDGAGKY